MVVFPGRTLATIDNGTITDVRFLNLNNVAPVQDDPLAAPNPGSVETSPLTGSLYVITDDQGNVIVPEWPAFNAHTAAAIEARGWPDFDPSSLATTAAEIEAATIEAQGWPDFDPSSLGK